MKNKKIELKLIKKIVNEKCVVPEEYNEKVLKKQNPVNLDKLMDAFTITNIIQKIRKDLIKQLNEIK